MNIIYATDGSDCARVAGTLLGSLPLPVESHVTVLSAIPEYSWLDTPLIAEVCEAEEAAAQAAADSAAAGLCNRGILVSSLVRYRNPAPAILEQAHDDGASLIVVGSHGKDAVQRFLIGSVSERVARYAPCSVLVARGSTLRRAIVAVDGSPASERALDALTRFPLPADVELKVTHVLRPSDLRLPATLVAALNSQEVVDRYERECRAIGERIVRHAQDLIDLAGRAAVTEVRYGSAADELIAAAREWEADLIVVGSENRSALGRLFLGSVSSRVLHHAPCSVLIARSPAE
jgi:nucleotide-binding universal stress UspA family protein